VGQFGELCCLSSNSGNHLIGCVHMVSLGLKNEILQQGYTPWRRHACLDTFCVEALKEFAMSYLKAAQAYRSAFPGILAQPVKNFGHSYEITIW
jgi:hypothetical protein